jgi:hypothetical protein
MCIPPCAAVARDHLPNAEAGGQIATPGGPNASRSHVERRRGRMLMLPAAVGVDEVESG